MGLLPRGPPTLAKNNNLPEPTRTYKSLLKPSNIFGGNPMLKKAVIWSPVEEFSLPSPFIFLPQDFSALLRLLFISPGTPVRLRYGPPPNTHKTLENIGLARRYDPGTAQNPGGGGKGKRGKFIFSWSSHPRQKKRTYLYFLPPKPATKLRQT